LKDCSAFIFRFSWTAWLCRWRYSESFKMPIYSHPITQHHIPGDMNLPLWTSKGNTAETNYKCTHNVTIMVQSHIYKCGAQDGLWFPSTLATKLQWCSSSNTWMQCTQNVNHTVTTSDIPNLLIGPKHNRSCTHTQQRRKHLYIYISKQSIKTVPISIKTEMTSFS
jgi:hypothetical protein